MCLVCKACILLCGLSTDSSVFSYDYPDSYSYSKDSDMKIMASDIFLNKKKHDWGKSRMLQSQCARPLDRSRWLKSQQCYVSGFSVIRMSIIESVTHDIHTLNRIADSNGTILRHETDIIEGCFLLTVAEHNTSFSSLLAFGHCFLRIISSPTSYRDVVSLNMC